MCQQLLDSILDDFQDVFPNELPRNLPPQRNVDHQIELIPGAALWAFHLIDLVD